MPTTPLSRCRPYHSPRSGGFTLIESLVTIIVMSIGVLALVILQLRTLADNRTASARNIATVMAYNLADQVRSNEAGLAASAYDKPTSALGTACYTTNGCTPAQIAANGYKTWLDDVAAALPGGTGTICIDSTPNDGTPGGDPASFACDGAAGAPYVIKIWWREEQGATQQFVTALVP